MSKASVLLLGKNVLLEVRKKTTIDLQLPEAMKKELAKNGELFDVVIVGIGKECTIPAKVGDIVITPTVSEHMVVKADIGNGKQPYILCNESFIAGIQK